MRCIFLLLCLLTPSLVVGASRPSLQAPMMLEGENLGDVGVFISKSSLELESESLWQALGGILVPESLAELKLAFGPGSRLTLAQLKSREIDLRFDEAALVLQLELSDALRARKRLNVRREIEDSRPTVGPTAISGYINATAAQGFRYPQAQARLPFLGNFGLVSNNYGFVLESGSTYSEAEEFQWRREDTRLSRDFEAQMLRVSAGDIPLFTSGYQNARPLGGISVSRQFAIQPYLNIRPINNTEVIVRRPSVIEVYVNDAFVSRLNASPGPVQVADFPLFSGINKVDLKITDDTGRVEWVNLNLLYDAQLLGTGVQQFSYQLGAPSEIVRNDRRYDDRNLTYSLFHRFGVNDRLTLGGSLQGDRRLIMGGNDFLFLTRAGLVSGDLGISRLNGGLTAGAGRVRFRSLDYKLGQDKPIRSAGEIEYKARSFASLGQTSGNDFSWKYDLSLSKPLTSYTSLGVGAQYLVNRMGQENRRSARLDFTSELNPEWRTTFNYAVERENRLEHRFQVLLSWIQADGKFFGNLSYDYPTKTTRLQASRNPSTVVDDFRATAGVERSPTVSRGDVLLEYTHEKAQVRADHVSSRPLNGATSHDTTLTASTALAWAGSTLALSRPITDSFALVAAKPLFTDYPVLVNRLDNSAEAEVGYLGPAVLPNLTSYNEHAVVLDPSALPLGYSLGQEYYRVRPTYRSGVKLLVGGESSALVSGRLRLPGGAPLSLATGEVKRAGEVVATFFTNREGSFLLENLPPGAYEMHVDDKDFRFFSFTLRPEDAGLVKLPPHELSKGSP